MRALSVCGALAVALIAAGCGGGAVHRPPKGFEPASVTALPDGTVWVLGSVTCGMHACASIARTSDGGKHFVSIPSPRVSVPVNGSAGIDTLAFGTHLDGYAFNAQRFGAATGSALWQTGDGGSHWQRSGLRQVRAFAIGGGSAFAVTTTGCAAGSCHGLELERSVLGAGRWTGRRLPVADVEPLVALTAHGPHVWMSVSLAAGGLRQILLTSHDGGKTFATSPSPCVTGLGGRLAAASTGVVWAVCPTGMLAGVERTADAGRTWTSLAASGPLPNGARVAPGGPELALLATGDRSELLRTQDGGRTFSTVVRAGAGMWGTIVFSGGATAVALRSYSDRSGYRLVRSVDGGRHWSAPIPIR